MFKTFHGVT